LSDAAKHTACRRAPHSARHASSWPATATAHAPATSEHGHARDAASRRTTVWSAAACAAAQWSTYANATVKWTSAACDASATRKRNAAADGHAARRLNASPCGHAPRDGHTAALRPASCSRRATDGHAATLRPASCSRRATDGHAATHGHAAAHGHAASGSDGAPHRIAGGPCSTQSCDPAAPIRAGRDAAT
jgi:hypothetical protein